MIKAQKLTTGNTKMERPNPAKPPSQRYYEIEALVPPNHRLVLDLPAEVPPGPIRLAIIYPARSTPDSTGIKALLMAMPDVGTDEDFARRQDLGLVTRNISVMAHTGVAILNPF
jgi:hypothetical protein